MTNVQPISETLNLLLTRSGRRIMLHDRATGQDQAISPDLAAAPDGLLPVFLAAADAVWRDATGGTGLGVHIERDPQAFLGYRAHGASGVPFATVMLCAMEAIEQVAQPGVLPVNALNAVWRSATERAAPAPGSAPGSTPGVAP